MSIRVFISSTFEDLEQARRAVQGLVNRFADTEFVGMEDFGARDETALKASLLELDRCQLYIGIFGERYGSGITEKEYLHAQKKNLPCFVYWKRDEGILIESAESVQQKELRESLRKRLHKRHTVSAFDSATELVAAIAADLHRFLFERLTSAVRSLRPPHANRVRRFVEAYMGSPDSRVPFGGRGAELAQLDAWLDDSAASPYCLLLAPAGRGKSALLVRWSNEVAARGDRAVVFFPISIRFGTNQEAVVSTYLRSRFSQLHGESSAAADSLETIDATLDECLSRPLPQGRELLLVMDGIDEAADWEPEPYLFPRRPARGVRVVVSARARPDDVGRGDWRRQLGWENDGLAAVVELDPLEKDGIKDVLRQVEPPNIRPASKRRLIDELHRLTGGDPLMVRLYLDEIALGASIDSLSKRLPGLGAFLRNWWRDQQKLWRQQGEPALLENTASLVLSLLACSLGPLRRDELLQLGANENLTSPNIEAVLPSLSRLVIGDGEQLAYAFGHPRFGHYYYETRLSVPEREAFEARFLAWGRETMRRLEAGKLSPDRIPVYLVRHYGAHLERSGSEETPVLLKAAWREAWYAHEGEAYTGFLADVSRAMRAAQEVNRRNAERDEIAPQIGVRMRCALYQGSVRSRRAKTPVKLFALGLEHGVLTGEQALASIRMLDSSIERAQGLTCLVPLLEKDQRQQAIEEAFEFARSSDSEQHAASVVKALAPFLNTFLLREALRMARELTAAQLVDFLGEVAPHLPDTLLAEALQLANSLNDLKFVQAHSLLLERLPAEDRPSLLEAMKDAVSRIPLDGDRILALCHLARHSPEVVEEALGLAERILVEGEYPFSSGGILAALAGRLDPERHWERTWKLYKSAEKNMENAVIAAIWLARRFPEAVSEVRRLAILHGPNVAATTIEDMIVIQPAWEAILVFHLPLSERQARASRCLEALVKTGASEDALSRSWTEKAALSLLSRLPEKWAVQCVEYAKRVESDSGRALVLQPLLPRIPEAQRRAVLRDELNRSRIRDEAEHAAALSELVERSPRAKREELAETVRRAASRMTNGQERNRVIARTAPWLAVDRADVLVRDAFNQVADIDHEFSRSDALAALAPCLPEDLHPAAIEQALALLPDSDYSAVNALFGLMSSQQRNQAFDEMMERVDFLMMEMGWKLSRLIGPVVGFLSEDQRARVLRLSTSLSERDRADFLAVAAPYLSADQLQESRMAVQCFDSAAARARGLSALLPYLPKNARDRVFAHAHRASQSIQEDPFRAWALIDLLAVSTQGADQGVLAEALQAAGKIEEAEPRAEAFRILFVKCQLRRSERLQVFERMLESARGSRVASVYGSRVRRGSLGRGFLLRCIAESADALVGLGGEAAIEETFCAIRDAAAWWP